MYTRFTPENITKLKHNQIFVFGSNLAGRHGKGAALLAYHNFGAIYYVGEGPQGMSYAIPTKDENLNVLSLQIIKNYIFNFIKYANNNLSYTFLVTRIGCGLSGYTDKQIAPFFKDAYNMKNVYLPKEFINNLDSINTI